MLSIRVALAIFVVGSAILVFLTYRWYRSHVDYCEGAPEVVAGGDSLSCLEPQHWSAFVVVLMVLGLVELALAVFVGVAFVRSRKRRRLTAETL